jgi:hypothetical protein
MHIIIIVLINAGRLCCHFFIYREVLSDRCSMDHVPTRIPDGRAEIDMLLENVDSKIKLKLIKFLRDKFERERIL